jgi:ferredoxin
MQYEVVPSIMPERCNSITRHCSVCLRRCPSQAIRTDETGYALIEKEKCTGCGICVRACPSQAVLYPGYNPAEITKQIDVLLSPGKETRSSRRSILFACRNSTLMDSDFPCTGGSVPEGFFPIVVPCLGMLSSFYLLYAFLNGATGVGMISCSSEKCAKGTDHDRLIAERDLTRTVLKNLGIRGRRVKLIEADSLSNLQKGLQCFSESLDEIDPSECSPEECVPVSLSEYSLPALLRTHACRPFIIEGSSAMPVGMVSLKPDSSCTLCGVCVRYCPSGAMTEAGGDAKELRFHHMKCVACGECVGRCPEKALLMKRAVDTESLCNPHSKVISREAEIACSECGTPFLTEAMLRRLRTGFSVSEADSILRMCPDCRERTAFSGLV